MVKEKEFYSPTRKQSKEMLQIILEALNTRGFEGDVVRGAFNPTIQIDVPQKRKHRMTSYSITVD